MSLFSSVLRRGVTAFHCALAVSLGIDAAMVLQQSLINLIWEHGFYGTPTTHTSVLMVLAFLTLALGVFQVAASAVYLYGRDGGGVAILVGSIALTCIVHPLMKWAVIAVGFLVLVESIVERVAAMPETE